MKPFEKYFNEDDIIRQICSLRVNLAKRRSKKHLLHLLTSNPRFNYHKEAGKRQDNALLKYQRDLNSLLTKILPPRKKWINLGEKSRTKKIGTPLNSTEKNLYSLLKTIALYKKKHPTEKWLLELNGFIADIRNSAFDPNYHISPPIVIPKLKEKINKTTKNECRPLCMYAVKDRIILSITNKFLTRYFDDCFEPTSYAFRSRKDMVSYKTVSHHDCIRDILTYRQKNNNSNLFVVECDMKKFFDTVNHDITVKAFYDMLQESSRRHPEIDNSVAAKIFMAYLNSYSFNTNVPNESDLNYWQSYNIPNGFFGWIENDDLNQYYISKRHERIGIPQGGALSGLIANIYLNNADKKLSKLNIFYSRFCDDMIIITNSLNESVIAKDIYIDTLKELKLFPHKFTEDINLISFDEHDNLHYKPFWIGKSKGPYQWGSISEINFPWIGFVGYEISYEGDIRVRKKSLLTEARKQKKIVKEIRDAVKIDMRKPKGTATESAINRLIGMSVGRITLHNFESTSADLCWKNGFRELSMNKHSVLQIKYLDRNRNKHYYKLVKDLKEPEFEVKGKARRIVHYNKPFSYYFQVLQRKMLS